MAREWTDEEVQKEISDAVQIVRADKIDTLLRNRLSAPSPNPNDPSNNPPSSSGDPGNPNPGNPPTKNRSLWWGNTE